MNILFLGDIVGRPGRRVIEKMLPEAIAKHKVDVVIANAENLAGGKGITPKTLREMQKAGVDAFTGGNHIFKNPEGMEYLEQDSSIVSIPANFSKEAPGKRWQIIGDEKGKRLLVVSLLGRTYMAQQVSCPFQTIDEILETVPEEDYDASLVDIHAEATSEKYALKAHLDGRASFVVGTHTHVPTADADITPKGTAFQCDAGMNGSFDSCIGVKSSMIIRKLRTQLPVTTDLEKKGRMQWNAVFVKTLQSGKAKSISALRTVY